MSSILNANFNIYFKNLIIKTFFFYHLNMTHFENNAKDFSYNATPPPSECNVRYAITFGEAAILHVGGKEYGNGRRDVGFTVQELMKIADSINSSSSTCSAKVISISSVLPEHLQTEKTNAGVLVIRNGARKSGARKSGARKSGTRKKNNGREEKRKVGEQENINLIYLK